MYNVNNNNLARWFTSYIEGLQVLISGNIATFFIAEGIMSYADSRDPGEVPCSVAPTYVLVEKSCADPGIFVRGGGVQVSLTKKKALTI